MYNVGTVVVTLGSGLLHKCLVNAQTFFVLFRLRHVRIPQALHVFQESLGTRLYEFEQRGVVWMSMATGMDTSPPIQVLIYNYQ